MKSKTIAASLLYIGLACEKYSKTPTHGPRAQRGVSLIELMVGITIGLLVVAVAMSALMVSRGVSGTVSDVSGIQQQAAYAMRVIGLQLRQAGSLYLNPNPNPTAAAAGSEYLAAVAFETMVPASGAIKGFDPATDTLSSASGALIVGYRRYKDPVFTDTTAQSLARNCLGGPTNTSGDQRVENIFQLNGSEVQCGGNSAAAQPIVQNVANFQLRYLMQDITSTPGTPTIKSVTAAAVGTEWNKVQGVEVCLVLYGSEPIDMPAGSSYTDCDGTTAVNMTTLIGARARRMHMVFRNVFQLRSQGLM
jgi:type IV pilus assembly protein PilW